MARIRSIKPEITLDEDLADLGFAARYFFLNLWCHCDRDGRCEDRPRKLQALILPWDPEVDANILLDELAPKFLVRYEVGGKRYLQVVHFDVYQKPQKATASKLPPVPDTYATTTRPLPDNSRQELGVGEGVGDPYGEDFERVWKEYPKKVDKGEARKAYIARRRAGVEPEILMLAVKNYATSKAGQPLGYLKNGSGFFAKEGQYLDWLEGDPTSSAAPGGWDPNGLPR